MFLVGLISWWYSLGWRDQISLVSQRLAAVADQWSIGELAASLFAPFRQMDTGKSSGALNVRFRAAIDKLIGRLIGAVVRLFMIVLGMLIFSFSLLAALVWIVLWPFLPLLPVLGFILMTIGYLPWSNYV